MSDSSGSAAFRIGFIDYARGVAAFMVLLQHSYERFFPEIGEYVGKEWVNFGQLGVVIFFLVSGFIIPFSLERSRSLGQFFTNRVFRIYPLYGFIILLQLVLIWLHIRSLMPESSWLKIGLTHLFFAQEYFPSSSAWSENLVTGSWTLFIEAVWYVLFAGLFMLRMKHLRIFYLAIGFFLLLTVAGFLLEKRLPMGRIGMLMNCFLGLHFYRHFKGEINEKEFLLGLFSGMGVIFFGLWVAFGHFSSDFFTLTCVWTSWFMAYSAFGLFYLTRAIGLSLLGDWLSFLGKVSYSVYLMHFTILTVVLHYFQTQAWLFLTTLLVVVVFSHFSYEWIEKPAIRFGKNWGKRFF